VCGIAGIRLRGGGEVDRGTLELMAAQLRHRGPDEVGFWNDHGVGLAHTRLSIIDLNGSHQPMADARGRRHVVFNGEILNYREIRKDVAYPYRTDGDTEVLLALFEKFGPDGVHRLRGQFAYALHDSDTGETHLFRDRLGILPLYYYSDSQVFAFASEIKALYSVMRNVAVDTDSLHDYFAHRGVPAPFTLIRGVRKLPQGHHLVIDADCRYRISPYWSIPRVARSARRTWTAASATDAVDTALRASVRDCLVADVPVGVYLSGGVDSSVLTAMAAREGGGGRLHTFGAVFGDSRFDEGLWARRVSDYVGTQHHEVHVTPADFGDNLGRLSWYRDGPLSEPADVAVFKVAELAHQYVKVALSGEGSDEIFAGYPKYLFAGATRWVGSVPSQRILHTVERALPANQVRIRTATRVIAESSYQERLRAWFAPFTARERDRLVGRRRVRPAPAAFLDSRGDSLDTMLFADTVVLLPDSLLERGDRMSMAASLEVRPPFADHRLVELAFALPNSVKIRDQTTKWVLKEVARRYLPSGIVDRPKVGFRVPLDQWFRNDLRSVAFDMLTSASSYARNNLDSTLVTRILTDHVSGRREEEWRIWTLLSLEFWYQELVARLGSAPGVS